MSDPDAYAYSELLTQYRVQRGIDLLDEYFEGSDEDWPEYIDPAIFDINNCSLCVLGQVFGGYTKAVNVLGIPSVKDQMDHGFDASGPFMNMLQKEWERRLWPEKETDG